MNPSTNQTYQTFDQGHIGVTQQPQGLNSNAVYQRKSLNKSNKAKEQDDFQFLASPFEKYCPTLSLLSIESTAKVSDHGNFQEIKRFLQEVLGNNILLPENGEHEDTPYNMHLTDSLLQGIYRGLAPVQHQEGPGNIYYEGNNFFIDQSNLNSPNLGANIDLREGISHFGPDVDRNAGVDDPIYDLPTANFNDKTNNLNPMVNMNDVFRAEDQDEWGN